MRGVRYKEYRKNVSYLFRILILAILYMVSARLGLKLAFVNESATAIWPPIGIALAALLIYGYRLWPGILFGAFFANLATSGLITSSIFIAIGNTLAVVAAAYIVNRFANGKNFFDKPEDIFKFATLAGATSTLISASIGTISLYFNNLADSSALKQIWLTWWLGDSAGIILVTPLIVLWIANSKIEWKKKKLFEAILLLISLVSVSIIVFGGLIEFGEISYPLTFLVVPFLIWAGLSFGQREGVTAAIILSGIATWGTLNGHGPFSVLQKNEALILLQVFIGIMSVMTLSISSVVSERIKAEKESRRLAQEIALKNAAISVRKNLEQSYKKLKGIDELKSRFLTNTSHELKTPITPIIIQTQMLLEESFGKLSSKQKKSLEMVLKNMKDLNKFIDDILEFSVIQTEGLHLELEEANIEEVIKEAVDSMQPLAKQKKISIIYRQHILPRLVFDKRRIREVLINLISNAIKYTEKGRITIEARHKGNEMYVMVKDTGIGIERKNLEKLFKPFSQVSPSYQQRHKGTGLGLAICKGIIEKHKGRIWLVSVPGKGSAFYFTLPANKKNLIRTKS